MARRALALARSCPLTRMIALSSATTNRRVTASVLIPRVGGFKNLLLSRQMNSSGNESHEGEMLKWDKALYVR